MHATIPHPARLCRKRLSRELLGALAALTLACVPLARPAVAQVVELNPVPVTGTIRVGDLIVTSLTVRLSSSSGSVVQQVQVPPDTSAATYSTIVQVPAGGTAFYRLNVSLGLRTPDASQAFAFGADVPGAHTVRDGEPATIDFVLDPPSVVRFELTADPGDPIEFASLRAERFDGAGFGLYLTSLTVPAGGVADLVVDLPVLPNVVVRCSGFVNLASGRGAQLEPAQLVTAPDGGAAPCAMSPADPPPTGGIRGDVDFFGDLPVDSYLIGAKLRGGVGGPPNITLEPPFAGPGNRAEYAFDDLPPGQYDIDTMVTLRDGLDNVFLPLEESVGVSADGSTLVVASICQARAVTSFAFGGLTPLDDYVFGERPVSAVRQGFGQAGSSRPLADPRSADPIEFVVRDGRYNFATGFDVERERFEPGGYSRTRVSGVRFHPAFDVACGETVTLPTQELETGRVEVRFRVADGRPLSNPLLDGTCQHRDEDTGALLYSYRVDANSATGAASVSEGLVPVEAPAAECDFVARATVSGANLTFGALNDVEIVPGVTVVIDIEGPRVEIASPAPGQLVAAGDLLVTGVATDDGEVVSVAVNGVAAELVPSGNPSDPREVLFSATVPLAPGETRIAAVAVDDDGNETEASLDVVNATPPDPPPSIEITHPASGETLETETVLVEGIASDDGEIVRVEVNGIEATLDPTGNPQDPSEVSFQAELSLVFGNNVIVAVATDDAGNETEARLGVLFLPPPPPPLPCDVNGDEQVDILDVSEIFAARGSTASGPDDPRDSNGDGIISINDGRLCVLECTNPRCAP